MPKQHLVTQEQVMAARLVMKIDRIEGIESDPIIVKIANAGSERRPDPAESEPSDEDEAAED